MKDFTIACQRIVVLVSALWLAGCSGLDHSAGNGPIPKGMGLVFGRISLRSPASGWQETGSVTVINTTNSKIVRDDPVKDLGRDFYWFLPPGQYAIFDLQQTTKWLNLKAEDATSSRRIFAEFSVNEEGAAVYVGTLHLESLRPTVADNYDDAVQEFHARFPTLNTIPIKNLLHFQIPR